MDAQTGVQKGGDPGRLPSLELGRSLLHKCQQREAIPCSAQSMGTTAWIAEYGRFLKRCVAEVNKGEPDAVREAFDSCSGCRDHHAGGDRGPAPVPDRPPVDGLPGSGSQ